MRPARDEPSFLGAPAIVLLGEAFLYPNRTGAGWGEGGYEMRVNGAAGGGGRGGSRTAKGLLTYIQRNTLSVKMGSWHSPVSWLVLLSSGGTTAVDQGRADFRAEAGGALEINCSMGQVGRRGRWNGASVEVQRPSRGRHSEFSLLPLHSAQLSKAGSENLLLQPQAASLCCKGEASVFATGSLSSGEPSFLFQITPSIGSQDKWNRL